MQENRITAKEIKKKFSSKKWLYLAGIAVFAKNLQKIYKKICKYSKKVVSLQQLFRRKIYLYWKAVRQSVSHLLNNNKNKILLKMAINYVKVKRNLTVGSNPGERFLARIFRTGNDVTLEQLAENISEASTLSSADILAALKALESQIAKSVLNGQTVRLGYLGSFVPSIEAKAVNTVDEVTADSIMRARCRFVPSPIFKNKLKNCKFTLANLDIAGLQ